MFDYQTSKHAHFDAACRAFAIEHNLEDVAAAVGIQWSATATSVVASPDGAKGGDEDRYTQREILPHYR